MFGFLFSPQGRVSRQAIWLGYVLPYIGVAIGAAIIDMVVGSDFGGGTGIVSILVSLFYFWPSIAVSIKRFHDRNMSGWWVLWSTLLVVFFGGLCGYGLFAGMHMIAIGGGVIAFLISLYFFVLLYILPGTEGDNDYGADPRQA